MAFLHPVDQVVELADATRRDDRDGNGVGDGPRQAQIEALLGAVPVHRREQDLAGAEGSQVLRPIDGVEAGHLAPTVGVDLEATAGTGLGVDGNDDALTAELLGRLADELRALDGGGVDGNLVGPGQQQLADVAGDAHAAADGERHEALLGGAGDDVEDSVARLDAGRDVEKAELVRPFAVVDAGLLDRIAGIHQIDEVHTLDDASAVDVEARYDPGLQHCPFTLMAPAP